MCGPLPIHSDHQDDEIIFRIRNLELNLYLPLASWEATANVYMYIYIVYIYIHITYIPLDPKMPWTCPNNTGYNP